MKIVVEMYVWEKVTVEFWNYPGPL